MKTINAITKDMLYDIIDTNLTAYVRHNHVLSIGFNVRFKDDTPHMVETFVYDESESILDADSIIEMLIHTFANAWHAQKQWNEFNGTDINSSSKSIFNMTRVHNMKSFMAKNRVVNEYKSVNISQLKIGNLLIDTEGDIHRVHSVIKDAIIISNDFYSKYTVCDLNTASEYLCKMFPGLNVG